MDAWFDHQRDRLLSAVFSRKYDTAARILRQIAVQAEKKSDTGPLLSELEQKILRQILVMGRQFKDRFAENAAALNNSMKRLRQILAAQIRRTGHQGHPVQLAAFMARLNLSAGQLNAVYQTVTALQLTSGCTHFCRRCNEWALPGVRKHFSFDAVRHFITRMAEAKNGEYTLYGASDPLDWEDGSRTIADILDLIREQGIDLTYGLLTKVPKGKYRLLESLVEKGADISISLTDKNRDRISRLPDTIQQIHKQHDFDDLLIPAGQDEDFTSIKSSITDVYGTELTPDGVYIIIPTLTSALNPFGHKKIPVTRETRIFPKRMTGRAALLVDYFKPITVIDVQGKEERLEFLLDTQVETLLLDNGSDEINPPGMTNIREFFDIFTPPAIAVRKKNVPAVVKKLKQACLEPFSFRSAPDSRKTAYLRKIKAYLDFCTPPMVAASKRYAVSFFLEAVRRYALDNPVRVTIIRTLCREEIEKTGSASPSMPGTDVPLVSIFDDIDENSFTWFQRLKFRTLLNPFDGQITAFIAQHPAVFDPVADRFAAGNGPRPVTRV